MSAAGAAAEQFSEKETIIVGINPGSLASHQRFAEKLGLPFPLLVDSERGVARDYGVLKENGTGIQRAVYIIDKTGVIRYAKAGNPSTDELLKALA